MRTITEHHWCAFYQRSSSCRRRQRYYNATSLVGLPMIAVLIRELIHIGNDYEIVSMGLIGGGERESPTRVGQGFHDMC